MIRLIRLWSLARNLLRLTVCPRWLGGRRIAAVSNVEYREDQSDVGKSQTKVLGMGLRGPGSDSRTAKAYGRADGQTIRARGARAHAAAKGERTESARAASQAAGCARSDLLDGHARARGAYLRQGIARYPAGVPARLPKSDRRSCVSAR